LKNIFQAGELDEKVVISILETTTEHGAIEGKIQTQQTQFYNLDAIISVGYRVNSVRATAFRQLQSLGRIVNGYLDFAEEYAKQHIPLTMEDWAKHLNLILQANGKDLLQDAGKITAALAKQHAENEFEKYRPIQDRIFESDFDKVMKMIGKK
jgi:hypothetical protein